MNVRIFTSLIATFSIRTRRAINSRISSSLQGTGSDPFDFDVVQIIFQPFDQAIKCDLCRIGYKRYNGIFQVIIYGLQHFAGQVAAKLHTLVINIFIAAAAEIDTLETAAFISLAGR